MFHRRWRGQSEIRNPNSALRRAQGGLPFGPEQLRVEGRLSKGEIFPLSRCRCVSLGFFQLGLDDFCFGQLRAGNRNEKPREAPEHLQDS